jgi:hypothetical protein
MRSALIILRQIEDHQTSELHSRLGAKPDMRGKTNVTGIGGNSLRFA